MDGSLGYQEIMNLIEAEKKNLSTKETDNLIEALKKYRKPEMKVYKIFYNTKIYHLPLSQLLKRAGFHTFNNYKYLGNDPQIKKDNAKKLDICIVRFDSEYTKQYAIEEMARQNIRQTTLQEFLSLFIENPDYLHDLKNWIDHHLHEEPRKYIFWTLGAVWKDINYESIYDSTEINTNDLVHLRTWENSCFDKYSLIVGVQM